MVLLHTFDAVCQLFIKHAVLYFKYFFSLEEPARVYKKVPVGTSAYQAAWIVDSSDEDDEKEEV